LGCKVGYPRSIVAVFSRIAFRFEFFFPQFIGYYISKKLKEYKKKGWIEDYKVKSKRKGKYHYFFDMDLFMKIGNGGEMLWLKKRKDT
jgi:hypothetical protein